jgi:hypothetical protein
MRKFIFLTVSRLDGEDTDLIVESPDELMTELSAIVSEMWHDYDPDKHQIIRIGINDSVSLNESQKRPERLAYYESIGQEAPMRDWDEIILK